MLREFLLLLGGIVAAGVASLDQATEGFKVVTSEQARRLAVERAPRTVPGVALVDQHGAPFSLSDYRGEPVLIEFIYTSCPTLCTVLGDDFRRIEDAVQPRHDREKLALLSISFDIDRDGPPQLELYGERFGAKAPGWRVAVPSRAGLTTLLRAFGVVVLRDGFGGFIHNDALYVVDRAGRLVRIMDPESSPRLIEEALRSAS